MSSLFVFPNQAPTYGGENYASASLYFFETGTLTPAVTYQDGNLAVAHTHPVVADGGGVFPPIWLSPTTVYRVQLRDLAGTTVKDVDPYPVAFVSAVFSAPAITLGDGVGIQQLYLNGDTSPGVDLLFQNSGVNRILLRCSGAESGSNSGSDLVLSARDDAGASLGNIVTFYRSSQIADFAQAPTIASKTIASVSTTVTANTVASGTYTPTLTNVANCAVLTTEVCQFMRVGTVVTVSGRISVDPTSATTLTRFTFSLPVASNFASANQAGGCAVDNFTSSSGTMEAWRIFADPTNDAVEFRTNSITDATDRTVSFSFTYLVV